jgi:putative transcriptional regulator
MVSGESTSYLDGQMLIAMPGISDPRFERSVIYMCAHSEDGAMGIVVNKPAEGIRFADLLERLDIVPSGERIDLPKQAGELLVHFGGPVEMGRGFVLHTSDYFAAESTLPIDESIGLTATLDVLRAIASGKGPRHALLALGYSGWGPGQLEREIRDNGWLHCDADETLVFGIDLDTKYDTALAKLGISTTTLSSEAGHA